MKYWQLIKILNEPSTTEHKIRFDSVDINTVGEHTLSDMNLTDAVFLDCVGLPGVQVPETLKILSNQGVVNYVSIETIESIVVKSVPAPQAPKETPTPYKTYK